MYRGQKAAPITLLHALNSNAVVNKTIDKGRFRISCISKYLFGLPYYSRDYFGRPMPGPPAWLESQSFDHVDYLWFKLCRCGRRELRYARSRLRPQPSRPATVNLSSIVPRFCPATDLILLTVRTWTIIWIGDECPKKNSANAPFSHVGEQEPLRSP